MLKVVFLNKDGSAAIEYALIASLIAVVAITGMKMIGTSMQAKFTEVATNIQGG